MDAHFIIFCDMPTFGQNIKNMMRITKQLFSLFALFLLPLMGMAQAFPQGQQPAEVKTDFSDEDLAKFSKAAAMVNEIQQSAENQMINAIEEQGLDLEKFNEIAMSQQNPNAAPESIDEGDMKKFEAVSGDLQKIQMEMQPKMVEAIESTGIELNKYQEIVTAYQQSPELQQKIQEMMEN